MREILINLPEELVEYLDKSPYIGDRSEFIVMLIKRWQREAERSRREIEQAQRTIQTLFSLTRHLLWFPSKLKINLHTSNGELQLWKQT